MTPRYIQHSAHIAPGREGLFNLQGFSANLEVHTGKIVAERDFVIVHGRFSGFGAPVNWIAAAIPHRGRDSGRALAGLIVETLRRQLNHSN